MKFNIKKSVFLLLMGCAIQSCSSRYVCPIYSRKGTVEMKMAVLRGLKNSEGMVNKYNPTSALL